MAMSERKMQAFSEIEIDYSGPGVYWLEGPRGHGGELRLGLCYSEADLVNAAQGAVAVGSDDDVWTGWHTWREPEAEADE